MSRDCTETVPVVAARRCVPKIVARENRRGITRRITIETIGTAEDEGGLCADVDRLGDALCFDVTFAEHVAHFPEVDFEVEDIIQV